MKFNPTSLPPPGALYYPANVPSRASFSLISLNLNFDHAVLHSGSQYARFSFICEPFQVPFLPAPNSLMSPGFSHRSPCSYTCLATHISYWCHFQWKACHDALAHVPPFLGISLLPALSVTVSSHWPLYLFTPLSPTCTLLDFSSIEVNHKNFPIFDNVWSMKWPILYDSTEYKGHEYFVAC